ncbi:MAG: hypothetical protein AMXMBFR84_28960 [Candidatus Hydrogenedentota bacterium]
MATAWAEDPVPQPSVEILDVHPLFLFGIDAEPEAPAETYANAVITTWLSLPDDLKPYSALIVRVGAFDVVSRHGRLRAILDTVRASDIPVAVQLTDGDPAFFHPLPLVEELLRDYTNLKGWYVSGLVFEDYYAFGAAQDLGTPPVVRWTSEVLRLTRTYGRFTALELDRVGWLRVMSNNWCAPLFQTLRECKGYVLPLNAHTDGHTTTRQMALMGLWLEESAAHWGVSATSNWYTSARFVRPGVFGPNSNAATMPPSFYRAMILNGAMGGATVYSFPRGKDLWSGQHRLFWDSAIAPTLREVLEKSLVAPKEFVRKKCVIGFQMSNSRDALAFHSNLADADGVLDAGHLIHGAYGMERPGQVSELVLNSGRHFWVPILSPYALADSLAGFARVVRPGEIVSPADWTALLDQHYVPDASGTAFAARIARGVFVMHTRENAYEEQTYRIPDMPSPLRGLTATRQANGVRLDWTRREDDVAFRIYRRANGLEGPFVAIAEVTESYSWVDTSVTGTTPASYAISAITTGLASQKEVYEGTVNYGEYLAFSVVESRLAEEVLLTELLDAGVSQSLDQPVAPPVDVPWWPNYDGVPAEFKGEAETIVKRIEDWESAFREERLDVVTELYTQDYQDPQLWPFAYVKRAYQWFFEKYDFCRMDRQIRAWDFSKVTTDEQIRVSVYVRFSGIAVWDGARADSEAFFPRTESGEVWLTFTNKEGPWRIEYSDPALPNFRDILSFVASPSSPFSPGPDVFTP